MRALDLAVLAGYFVSMALIGAWFSRRAKTTERYFVGGRSYPGWLLGVSLFGAAISSITFVGYPADSFKTAWLRYLICLMLPIGVFIASRLFVPFFRRGNVTSVFEYLESRFGPGTRIYGATVFLVAQCIRISLIQYLVALLVHSVTKWDVTVCILVGGAVTAFYTIAGGIEAVIWTDFIQSVILTVGGLLILGAIIWKLPGGLGQLLSVGWHDGKFMLGDLDPTDQRLHAAPIGFALSQKTVLMMLIVGLFTWLAEYSTNQEVIQKYCAAKTAREARRAMWVCCLCSVPTWGYFMFLGTGLYVFYKVFPDPNTAAMLSGEKSAEGILPYFVTTQLPPGLTGIVVAAVLAAAMSSMSSAMNSISAVAITDVYRRHLAQGRDDHHYVIAAKLVTLASSIIMIAGAYCLFIWPTKTLQHLSTELTSIIAGGLLGLYMLGFFTRRGDGRHVAAGIVLTTAFSAVISLAGLGWLPAAPAQFIQSHFDAYYTGLFGNILMFILGYLMATLLPQKKARDWTNLTVWTQQHLAD